MSKGKSMFGLTDDEADALIFQIGISKPRGRGGSRHLPHAFTEQGVAMLSSVLRSERAIRVNIAIMRAFVRLRGFLGSHAGLSERLEDHEQRLHSQEGSIESLFDAISRIEGESVSHRRRRIGFRPTVVP